MHIDRSSQVHVIVTDGYSGRLHDYSLVRVRSRLHHVHLLLGDSLDDTHWLSVGSLNILRMNLNGLVWEGRLGQWRRRKGSGLYLDGDLSSTHM